MPLAVARASILAAASLATLTADCGTGSCWWIVERAELDPRHVAQANDAAVLARFDDDVLELGWILQPANEGEVRWKARSSNRWARRLAARDLQVLGADRRNHVARSQAEIGDLVGIEPQPHRIIARAEDLECRRCRQVASNWSRTCSNA